VARGIAQDVLRLDVSVANAFGVDVRDASEQLVRVKLDDECRNHLLHLQVLLHHSVGSVGNVVHHYVQVYLFRLVAIRVETLAHFHAVGVVQHLQDGQFSVLVPLVLEDLFDGDCLSGFSDGGLEHHTERTVADDFLSVVSHALLERKSVM